MEWRMSPLAFIVAVFMCGAAAGFCVGLVVG
jgi:hypothetical protein